MLRESNSTQDRSPKRDVLAIHVMRTLTRAQRRGRVLTLEDVARELGVRKLDVRSVISTLHAQGFVDAVRMRVTMLGLAVGAAVRGERLPRLRAPAARAFARAA
jgi:hypothetical protein